MREEIDLVDLGKTLFRHKLPILLTGVAALLAAMVFCLGFMEDTYTAKTSLYVLNQQDAANITSNDLTSSIALVNDYREIILSNKVTDRVKEELGLADLNTLEIAVESKNNTRIIEISVTSCEAELAAAVANSLAQAFTQAAVEIMHVENVSVIDPAGTPLKPSGPDRGRIVFLATLGGVLLASCGVVLMELLNTSFKNAEEVEKETGLPVLAQFAQITEPKDNRRGVQ